MRVRREAEIGQRGAQMQHRGKLDTELAGGMHRRAILECLEHRPRLVRLAEAAPERRVKQDHIDQIVADRLGELLEIDDHGVSRRGNAHELTNAPHAFQTPGRVLEIIILELLDRLADSDRLLDAPCAVRIETQQVVGEGIS